MILRKIISGGQTGVDSGALYAALRCDIPIAGFCPMGRINENGPIPSEFPLQETSTPDYAERTEINLLLADGTLILIRNRQLYGGTLLTKKLCQKHRKPLLICQLKFTETSAVSEWLRDNQISILNIAGPRESSEKGIEKDTQIWIERLINELTKI